MSVSKRLNRRSFVTRVTAGAVLVGGSMTLLTGSAEAQVTDQDPNDPYGHGRGGGAQRPGYTGVSDRDPTDPSGYGHGGSQASTPSTGVTDRDPSDPQGRGRGQAANGRTGITDNDPHDERGNGRGTAGETGPYAESNHRLVCNSYASQLLQRQEEQRQLDVSAQNYQLLTQDKYAVDGLVARLRTYLPEEERYQAFEQIRALSARWGINCGVTDVNCQVNSLNQLWNTQTEARRRVPLQVQQLQDLLARNNC